MAVEASTWRRSTRPPPSTCGFGSWPVPARRRPASRSTTLSKQVGQLRRDGKVDEAEAAPGREPGAGRAEQQLAAEAAEVEAELRDLLLRIPNLPVGRVARRRRRAPTTRSSRWSASTPTATPSTSGCRTGRSARARHPRQRAGRQDLRLDVHDAARAGRHAGAGAVPARARPQRRRVRGDPPADARPHRDAHRHRPAPEVRRRRLRHRARRPVVHPDRRGAAHVDRQRRDPRRGRAADAPDGVHAVLPARGRLGRS